MYSDLLKKYFSKEHGCATSILEYQANEDKHTLMLTPLTNKWIEFPEFVRVVKVCTIANKLVVEVKYSEFEKQILE